MRALLWLAIVASAIAQDHVISSDAPVRALSFSADSGSITGLCEDRRLRVWDARNGQLRRAVPFDNADLERVTLATPPDMLASASHDGEIQLWDPQTGTSTRAFRGPTPRVSDFAFSTDRKLLAGAGKTGLTGSEYSIRIWDSAGTEQRAMPAGLGGISALAFSPDGLTFVAASFDTNFRVWSTRNGELLRLVDELPVATFALAFSPDGKYLATGGADRIVYLWDTKTWKLTRKLSGQGEMISALAFSPDSRLLLTGGFSEFAGKNPVEAIFWDVNSGKLLRRVASANLIHSAVFSPDGLQAATANMDKNISLWTVPASGR